MKMELFIIECCLLTIDESLRTQGFHNSNQISVSIIQIRKLLLIAIDKMSNSDLETHKEDNKLDAIQLNLCQSEISYVKVSIQLQYCNYHGSTECQLISPACYQYLQSLDSIPLPHHSTHQRLYSKIEWIMNIVHFWKELHPV